MTSAPEYIADRSVWWEEGTKAVIRRQGRDTQDPVIYRNNRMTDWKHSGIIDNI